jgi:hypothetical protein
MDQHNFWYWLLAGLFSLIESWLARLPQYAPIGMASLFYNALLGIMTVFAMYFGSFLNLCWFLAALLIFLASETARGGIAIYRQLIKFIPLP